ncbi:hypothetical protein [Algoriphagus sediminis]|uniref:Glycosyltransferase RgtA/B/C/D-like domain-containing protein n=1 Tax=Algoriphagus sediminis TaxID=3057113 RepID=A0ABT7YDW8_9BACT|nr:hypothetical protein [Algoriphagus sediminis]MDN3204723.1 hypothetical protein [Algoriphagus sediminis]
MSKLASWVLFVSFFGILMLIIFAIPRGFDFSDEGFYLLLSDPFQSNKAGIINYDLFFKLLFKLTGLEFGIIGIRVFRLLSYLLGAFFLSKAWRNIKDEETISTIVFLISALGLFAGYGFLPPSLSYNSLSVVAVCIWFLGISKRNIRNQDLFLIGVSFSILFYSKISALVGLLPLTWFLLYKAKISWIKIWIIMVPGLFLEFLFLLTLNENGVSRILEGLSRNAFREDYGIIQLIRYSAVGPLWSLIVFTPIFILAQILKSGIVQQSVLYVISLSLVLWISFITKMADSWVHVFYHSALAVLAILLGNGGFKNIKSRERMIFCVLLILPYALHFGSNVYWFRLGIHYIVFPILAICLLIGSDFKLSNSRKFLIPLYSMSFLVCLYGLWISPFEGVPNWKADKSWVFNDGKSIQLSAEYIEFLKEINSEVNGYESGEIVSLYMNPGILYLLDRQSPEIPGYWSESQASNFLKEEKLGLILYNGLVEFPFASEAWKVKRVLTQPNGEKLEILVKK